MESHSNIVQICDSDNNNVNINSNTILGILYSIHSLNLKHAIGDEENEAQNG